MLRSLVPVLILTAAAPTLAANDAALNRMRGVQIRRWYQSRAVPYRGTAPLPGIRPPQVPRWYLAPAPGIQATRQNAVNTADHYLKLGPSFFVYRPLPPWRR